MNAMACAIICNSLDVAELLISSPGGMGHREFG